MKYDDFKIFKFSTISKIFDLKRYNFSRIYKSINFNRYKHILFFVADFTILIIKYIFSRIYIGFNFVKQYFLRIYKNIDFKRYKHILIYISNFVISIVKHIFFVIYKKINFKKYNFSQIYRYVDIRRYNFSKIYRYININRYINIKSYINIKRYRFVPFVPFYVAGIVVFLVFIYLSIPLFFNYDKSKLESAICKDLNIKCTIQGKIKYSFFPSPRIKIKDLIIQDFIDVNKTLGKVDNTAIKLSLYHLSNKSKLNFTKIEFKNAEINFDLHQLKEYKNFSKKKFYSKPINLKKGEINFFDDTKSIAIIRDVNFKYKTSKKTDEIILKGNFLNDDIYINLKNTEKENESSTVFILKFLDVNTKVNILNPDLNKSIMNGNVSFKKGKNRLTSFFDYKDDRIIFKQSNLRNVFLDGKFNGELKFLPYFNFDLNVDLNSLNFNSLYSSLVTLDEKNKKNLFKINNKINGQLNLSADKIFSKRTLIDSFESRIKFINGNILIEQLLLNLGKLGAADITGIINNNKKFSNFNFENNIFIDNLKRFYNKFGIFNKQNISSNLFISGNFDLAKLQLRFDEISNDKKFKDEDIAYIEKEFNNLLLEDGYASLFNFLKLKEFVSLTVTKAN